MSHRIKISIAAALLTGLAVCQMAPAVARDTEPQLDPWAVWSEARYEPVKTDPYAREKYESVFEPVPPEEESWDGILRGLEPDPFLNCDILEFPRVGVTGIMQSDAHGDVARAAALRALSRRCLTDAMAAGGEFADRIRNRQIVGVEFNWFHPSMGLPTAAEVQDVVVAYMADNTAGDVLLGYMYGMNRQQLTARIDMVEGMIGHSMSRQRVWSGLSFTTDDELKDLRITGDDITITGDVQCGDDITVVSWASNVRVEGNVQYDDDLKLAQVFAVEGKLKKSGLAEVPSARWSASTARAAAKLAGVYSDGDMHLTRAPTPGKVIFAEGDLTIEGYGSWDGAYTLVSARGHVTIKGSNFNLRPALSHTLAVAYYGDVRVETNESYVEGEIICRRARFKLVGHDNVVHGLVSADDALLGGDRNTISDGVHVDTEPYRAAVPHDDTTESGDGAVDWTAVRDWLSDRLGG